MALEWEELERRLAQLHQPWRAGVVSSARPHAADFGARRHWQPVWQFSIGV